MKFLYRFSPYKAYQCIVHTINFDPPPTTRQPALD
jgi:hypothetical protein